MFHGTNNVSKQIFQNFQLRQVLREFSGKYIPISDYKEITDLYEKFDSPVSLRMKNDNRVKRVCNFQIKFLNENQIRSWAIIQDQSQIFTIFKS